MTDFLIVLILLDIISCFLQRQIFFCTQYCNVTVIYSKKNLEPMLVALLQCLNTTIQSHEFNFTPRKCVLDLPTLQEEFETSNKIISELLRHDVC